jgi:hypothetical protein
VNSIRVILDVDQAQPLKGLPPERTLRINKDITATRIPRGMESGRAAVAFTAPLPNGNSLMLEMSMANFLAIADAFRAAEQEAAIKGN